MLEADYIEKAAIHEQAEVIYEKDALDNNFLEEMKDLREKFVEIQERMDVIESKYLKK